MQPARIGVVGLAVMGENLVLNLERNGFPVYLYHLKPAFASELRRELSSLKLRGVRVLATGEELRF